MCHAVNPQEPARELDTTDKQTFEMRCPDCTADIYQLMAGLCVAARYGLEMPEKEALKIAEDKYVDMDIHKAENAARLATLDALPVCCSESGDALQARRDVFEAHGVFVPKMIDGIIAELRKFDDHDLHEQAKSDPDLMRRLVEEYFHCG